MTPSRSEQPTQLGTSGAGPPDANLHPKWMTQELIEQTIRVWSLSLCREVKEAEAVDMLNNVRRLGAFGRRKAERRDANSPH